VHTDGWPGYDPLDREGYEHDITFLEYYLDEFTFRFNRRRSGNRGRLLLVHQAVAIHPVPYKSLVKCAAVGEESNHNL
jgi:hypothetical protein